MNNEGRLLTITVEAVSKRGKQLIKQHGDRWLLGRVEEHVSCFNGEGGVLIAPVGASWHGEKSRWVRATGWLQWNDDNLRPTKASILEFNDMPVGTTAGL